MPVQPQLFPDSPPAADGSTQHAPVPDTPSTGDAAPVWLQRLSLFILVIFCLYLGGFVTVLPWWTAVWDHNLFFTSHPWLWSILRRGPTRGIISGLGLLDIWIGVSEAVHYRDHRN
jgi:hypothetical protein